MSTINTVTFTPASYKDWKDTKNTYHLFFQILGKVKLDLMPRRNHWWQIAFHITPRGLTSNDIATTAGMFQMDIDLVEHKVILQTKDNQITIPLTDGLTVGDYYQQVQDGLKELGITAHVWTQPFENISTIPFESDTKHHTYDKTAIENYFSNLSQVHSVLKVWQHTYKGKISPVNNYWHSFDIATTFFSGRLGPDTSEWEPVSADAYSDEVMSFGWWPGDHMYEEAAFYAYMYPDPKDSRSMPLKPDTAFWTEKNGAGLAILKHDDVIVSDNHWDTVMEFYRNFYKQGCEMMQWDTSNSRYKNVKI